ncbi:MAG: hypothetical protein F6K48_14160 [Okeania sp. SIO3H1]|nr:hypothetical protein [Okeania sp. SIO3H1]
MSKNITTHHNSNEKPSLNVVNKVTNFFLTLIISAAQLVAHGSVTGTAAYFTQEIIKELDQTKEIIEFVQPRVQQAVTEVDEKFKQVIRYLDSLDKNVLLSKSLEMLGLVVGTTGAIHALRLAKKHLIVAI